MQKTQAIVLIGPTGTGKTPLGRLLEERGLWGARCRHFDFGAHLRRIVAGVERAAELTPEDVEFLGSLLRSGALLENERFYIAGKILRAFIAEHRIGCDTYVILNGLPRHVDQAGDVDAIVDVKAVIHLACPAKVVFERIRVNRGGDRAGRIDDNLMSVRNRLTIYARRIAPVLDHYRDRRARIETLEVEVRTTAEDAWKTLNSLLK